MLKRVVTLAVTAVLFTTPMVFARSPHAVQAKSDRLDEVSGAARPPRAAAALLQFLYHLVPISRLLRQ